MQPSADRIRRSFVLAALLLLAGGAGAFTFIRNESTALPVKWPAGVIPFQIMLGSAENLSDGTSFNTTADAAAQQWNSVLGSVRFVTTLTSGTASRNNSLNEMVFSPTVFGEPFDGNAVAVATQRSSGNERTEADIIFNSSSNRVWNSFRGQRPGNIDPNAIDLRRVALHELGHALGLTHPDEATPPQTVFAVMNSRVSSTDALTDDDIAGGQLLYGPPGVPANDRFANAFVLTLPEGSNSLVATGHNTNSTKETGEPNHAGNAGGSSVWWRWTAPGPGRVDLNTRTSVYDTTLGVYTGTTVGALTTIASDDDVQDGVIQASELSFSATANTTYHFGIDGFDRDTGGIVLNLAFSPVAGTAPAITAQPASQGVTAGNTANFSVTATGTEPLSFQWFFNNNAIAGATASSLAVSNAQPANAGSYHVVVTNAGGSVTSATATLTVTVPPPPAPPATGGGGGGGGATSAWFLVALAVLWTMRRLVGRDVPSSR